ncbi:hypothetical protein JYU34_006213 [Plutella xylostella]|uniref:Uncharacterized protein n=1 Tax=Plutella xylostella TaxID=51655 RepID=A0ABQ7QV56_PLUXY|nr:hypothetical protein JYU34_006213 [Plutella xylostella]
MLLHFFLIIQLLCMILFLKATVPVVSRHVGQYMKIIMRGPDTYTRTGLKEYEVDEDREAIMRRFPLQSMYRKFYDSSMNQNVTTQRQWRSISPHNTESKPLNRRRPTIGPMEYAPADDDTPRNANFWRPSNWFTQKLHQSTATATKAEESTTSLSPFYKNLLKNSEESHIGDKSQHCPCLSILNERREAFAIENVDLRRNIRQTFVLNLFMR